MTRPRDFGGRRARRGLPILLLLVIVVSAGVILVLSTGTGGTHATRDPVISEHASVPPGYQGSRSDIGTVSAPVVGEKLVSSSGTWSTRVVRYTYRWERCGRDGVHCAAIRGAATKTYTVTLGDVGHTVRAVVTARSASGTGSAPSHRTGVVEGGTAPPVNVATPYFAPSTGGATCTSGCAVEGQTITADPGKWLHTPTGYSYQWSDCMTAPGQPPKTGSCTPATGGGGTSASYMIGSSDLAHSLEVTVTAHNGAGASAPMTSAPSAVVAASQAEETFCTNAVATCGYIDPRAGSVGVPSGTGLTPSKSMTVTANGATVSRQRVTGSITIAANDVTVEDTEVVDSDLASGAIVITRGHHGTVITHDTIHGLNRTSGALAFAVYNQGDEQLREDHVYAYNVDRILVGSGTLADSYCLDNANIAGGHYECVYNGGGRVMMDHDVLLNTHDQTAAVFVESYFDNLSGVEVSNSMLAGGDYCIYGGSQGNNGFRNLGPETVQGNRFSRLYLSNCGQFGTAAYMPPSATWRDNIWDDTGRAVPGP